MGEGQNIRPRGDVAVLVFSKLVLRIDVQLSLFEIERGDAGAFGDIGA